MHIKNISFLIFLAGLNCFAMDQANDIPYSMWELKTTIKLCKPIDQKLFNQMDLMSHQIGGLKGLASRVYRHQAQNSIFGYKTQSMQEKEVIAYKNFETVASRYTQIKLS